MRGENRTQKRSKTAVKGGEWVAGAPGHGEGWAGHASLAGKHAWLPTRPPGHHTPALKPPETVGTWHPNLSDSL